MITSGCTFGISSYIQIHMMEKMSHPARSSHREIYSLKVTHPATTHDTLHTSDLYEAQKSSRY